MSTSEPKRVKRHSRACCLALFVVVLAALLTAQEPAPPSGKAQQPPAATSDQKVSQEQVTEADIQLMRQDIRAQRKKIVAANLPLTEEEATKFWPLYDRYIAETIKVNDVRYALIKEYAQNYTKMTDAQANSYITRWVALDRDTAQLRVKYVPEFEKVISPTKTALFFQIDRRVSMLIELQLADQVPLVNPQQ